MEGGRLKVEGDYSIDVYYDHVYGNAAKSSKDIDLTKKESYHYTEQIGIHLGTAIKDDLNLKFDFTGRHSTDKNVQAHRYELVKLYLGLTGEGYELAVGDLAELYSNYTFNTTFFGLKASYNPVDYITVKALAGRNKIRRDDQYEQVFGGGMVSFDPNPNLNFNASFMHTEITDLYPNATESNYRNDVWSLGSAINLFEKRLALAGEVAFCEHIVDRRDPLTERFDGFSTWAVLILKPAGEDLTLSFTHEYVEPDFKAVMGTHNTDKETFLLYADYKPSDFFQFISYYQFYRDCLTDKSPKFYRTDTHDAGAEFTIRPFTGIDYGYFKNLNLLYKMYYTYDKSEDRPESVNRQNIRAEIGAENSIEKYWGKTGWTMGLGLTYDIDHRLHAEDSLTTNINSTLNLSTDAYGFDFAFNLGFSVEFTDTYVEYPKNTFTKTTAALASGIVVTNNRWLPYKTVLGIEFAGTFIDEDIRYDSMENDTTIFLSQVLFKKKSLVSTIGLSYSNKDCRSQNPADRYGQDEYRVNFEIKF
ncbi:MAG: hypothetical protein JW984_07705 [Deltaproteobacteria bacterium]|uniref:Uncharacterized protein n=1 Tax=Candidatus Zymogenus saltonus TaxID=2844893 RepID=A0A9D8PP36_9DELT|nr:hypothetical protein [Candidatus Zymogenus saltonus]